MLGEISLKNILHNAPIGITLPDTALHIALKYIIIIIIFIRYKKHVDKAHRYIKSKHVIIQKSTMNTSVYKNMIYRKLIEDKHVDIKLRGAQMVN